MRDRIRSCIERWIVLETRNRMISKRLFTTYYHQFETIRTKMISMLRLAVIVHRDGTTDRIPVDNREVLIRIRRLKQAIIKLHDRAIGTELHSLQHTQDMAKAATIGKVMTQNLMNGVVDECSREMKTDLCTLPLQNGSGL